MAEVVLETHGLTMRFGGVVASNNVDFKLRARELRCLIGPNGAGKSTFFNIVTGMIARTSRSAIMIVVKAGLARQTMRMKAGTFFSAAHLAA